MEIHHHGADEVSWFLAYLALGAFAGAYVGRRSAHAGMSRQQGARTATLTITDNAAGSPQTVTLTAKATAPAVQLADVDYGDVVQGASVGRVVTVNDTGDGNLLFSGITITGDYSFTSNCMVGPWPPYVVTPGQSCQIT